MSTQDVVLDKPGGPAGPAGGSEGAPTDDRGDSHVVADTAEGDKKEVVKDADEGDKDGGKKKEHYIPKSRFDDVIRKSKEREEAHQQQINALQQQLEANKVDENIEALDARIEELASQQTEVLMEGDKENAKAIGAEMRRLEKARGQMVSFAYSAQAQMQAIEQYRYDNSLDTVESLYPVLDEDSDSFNQETTQEISDLMLVYQNQGMSKAAALGKAVKARLGDPVVTEGKVSGSALKEERTTDARRKAMAAVNRQPPDISKIGLDSDKLGGGRVKGADLSRMSQDQFAKLDEATLATLRGDDFEGGE